MRRHAYSWTTRVVLGLITVIFIFWGVGAGFFSQVHPVATVNGKRILPDEVDQEATRLRRRLQQTYGANAAELLKTINLRREALDRIIESRLIAEQARHLGLRISNAALQKDIASQAAFQAEGQFNFEQYQEVLRENDLLPSQYEAEMRAAMLADAVQRMVEEGVQVSDADARQLYALSHQKITVAYFEIPYEDFSSKMSPTPRQVEEFYKKENQSFREPEKVKIVYVYYDPVVLGAKTSPTEKQIEKYYKTHAKSQFTHPDEVRARHILIATAPGASETEKSQAKSKAEDILKQLKQEADFASLAAKYSDDPGSRKRGGDLGTFPRGQMVKPFEDAAFSMKPGETRIVETEFGVHVLRLDSFTPAHTDTLQQARPKIIEALIAQAGEKRAREALGEDLRAALSGQTLDELARKRGLQAVETPAFSRDAAFGVVPEPKLVDAAFKLTPGQVRAVIGTSSPYLVKLVSREPSRIPALKEIEPQVRDAFIRSAASSEALAKARQLLEQIKSAADFNKVAETHNLAVRKTDPFVRSSNEVPGIGPFPEVAEAAATVSQTPGVIGRVMEHEGNSYVFEVLTRTPPPDEEWKDAAPRFTAELLKERRAETWSEFLDALKAGAKITIDTAQLGEESPGAS